MRSNNPTANSLARDTQNVVSEAQELLKTVKEDGMNKLDHVPQSSWGFYVNVDGIDAAAGRIEAGGGEVTVRPHQVPDGSWIVQARDPQGASFALVSAAR